MCRWFAYLSPKEECLLEDVLITPVRKGAHSLAKQVHSHYLPKLISHVPGEETSESEVSLRNRLQNYDGFGIAWYTTTREDFVNSSSNSKSLPHPALYKSANPPTNDFNFHSICANTSTTTLLAHIRAATATAVTPVNNHPFAFGRHVIMHNGVVANFSDIRRDLLDLLDKDAYENIHGTTDSEHLAGLYMTFLAKNFKEPLNDRSAVTDQTPAWQHQYTLKQMKAALTSAFIEIIKLQTKALTPKQQQANSLNVCVTDGRQMVAFRFRNHGVEQPPSLYMSTEAGVTLNRKYPGHPDGKENPRASRRIEEHGSHVIIASEPSTYKEREWTLIGKNEAVLVDENGKGKVEPIEISDEYFAEGKTEVHG